MSNGITAIEWVVLIGVLGPPARLLLDRGFARLAPLAYAAVALAVAVWFGLATALAVWRPDGLHSVALGIGALAAAGLWLCRPGFGARRGLPRGSLSPFDSVRAIVDRRFYARRLEQYGPIFKMVQFDHPVICVVGMEKGQRLLREHEGSIGPAKQAFSDGLEGGFLRYMKPDIYEKYAGLFRAAISSVAVNAGTPATAEAIRFELDRIAQACARAPGTGASPGPYLERVTFVAFMSVMFDLDPKSELFDRFERLYTDLLAHPLSGALSGKTRESFDVLRGFVRAESARRRELLADRGPSCVLDELIAARPDLPDATGIDNLIFIVKVATPNTVGLMRWILKMLGDHPVWNERLRVEIGLEPAARSNPDLVDCVIMETLRLAQSEYRYRSVESDFAFEGKTFPKGWLIRQCVAESHRSASVFEDPEVFDPERFRSRRFSASEYSPFGGQLHACNGVTLTYMICRALIEELSGEWDWRIVEDGPLEREFRHWSHWRPSSKLRLSVSHRT